jgi:spermidine synthase
VRTPLRPLVVAFAVGAAVMAVEVLTPRLVARHLGTSVVVWSATLAVFLGGLAGGNAAGGALADRFRPRPLLAARVTAAAGALLAVPALDRVAEDAFRGLPLLPRAIASIGAAGLLPAFLLGCVPPALATWALESAARAPGLRAGRVLGAVAAAGAAGGVAGTYATGFVLVPSTGTTEAIRAVATATLAAAVVPWLGRGPAATPNAGPGGATPGRTARPRAGVPDAPLSPRATSALAFVAGAALLVLEVLAGRTTAVSAGNGIYTWTSVIGGVLVALAVGNLVGGVLADRLGPRRALGLLLVLGSVLALATLWAPLVLEAALRGGAPLPVRLALGVLVAWGPVAAAIGAASTALARAAVPPGGATGTGSAVGRVYALGTAGAIAGGLLTSPALLPAVGSSGTVCAVALALAVAGVGAGRRAAWPWAGVAVAFGLAAALPLDVARSVGLALGVREDAPGTYVRESAYYRIRVDVDPETNPPDRRVRRMRLDALSQGRVDLDDPTWTGYGYEGAYAAVTERAAPRGRPLRALFVGGGPYAFPRWLRATFPDAAIEVAEIDPEVTRAARVALLLPHAETMRVAHEDARTFVRDLPPDAPAYDFVFGDAFDDVSVPHHLTTVEFARALKARMARDGVYVLNAIDAFDSGRFVGAVLATLARVFAHVGVVGLDRRRDWFDNFVVVASDRAVDLEGLTRDDPDSRDPARRLPLRRYGPSEVAALRERAGGLVLTDDHAPVENLLAPVLR